MAESKLDKATRLVTQMRIDVIEVSQLEKTVHATCRGDSGEIYQLRHDRGLGWSCSSAVLRPPCSHLLALWHVVVRPGARP